VEEVDSNVVAEETREVEEASVEEIEVEIEAEEVEEEVVPWVDVAVDLVLIEEPKEGWGQKNQKWSNKESLLGE
jgi:hypothetical protein